MDNNGYRVQEVIERAVETKELSSGQVPYSSELEPGFFFYNTMKWVDEEPPDYKPDSRERDAWLAEFVVREPHLNGVLNTACSLVANRGWTLTGSEDLVLDTRKILHDADRIDGYAYGQGWRHYIRNASRAFYASNLGFISETGRLGVDEEAAIGPLAAIWSSDPTKFRLTGKPDYPLYYYPSSGGVMGWRSTDFFRISNNPVLDEKYHGLGYCAVNVCVELAKILMAVYRYDQEQLGARAPKGLLLLRNVSQRQWQQAMSSREAKLDSLERKYFGGVSVLAQMGPNDIDAKLIALSELPENFDRQNFITLLMYLYSLVFGFPPDEFWPVQIGWLLGRNTEAELGLERATQKGDADFFLAFQDVFQRELPSYGMDTPAVLFNFDERNDRGRVMAADVAHTWAKTVSLLYDAGLDNGAPLLEREQALRLLVDQGIVPAEYTDVEEETLATDTHSVRSRWRKAKMRDARSSVGIRMHAKIFPDKPIITYEWPTNKMTILYENGLELLKPRVWAT